MDRYFLPESGLSRFLASGEFAERFVTAESPSGLRYTRLEQNSLSAKALRLPRAADSTRSLFLGARSLVARYGPQATEAGQGVCGGRRLIAGLRACDLQALSYLDAVLLGSEPEDPFYKAARSATLLISVDCVQPDERCFCVLVGGSPYPKSGFDVNLSPVGGGYVVEVGSEAGRQFVEGCSSLLEKVRQEHVDQQAEMRADAEKALQLLNGGFVPSAAPEEVLAGLEDSEEWDRFSADCVECGACTQICPTCHCFYLWDQRADGRIYHRYRAWDSCLLSGYSRMAGPAGMKPNPRARFRTRFSNRFLHKYAWSPKQWGLLGCVGCGRCSEACLGQIDMRRVVCEITQCAAKR